MIPLDRQAALRRMIGGRMGITADGWFDFAIRDPGHPSAVNGGVNPCIGVVPHSAEGNFRTLQELHDFHLSRNLAPAGKRASWGATNLKDGRFVQHFPVTAQTWTSGCAFLNDNFFAWENEGVAGEPLTDAQFDNNVRVIKDLSARGGWTPRRPTNAQDKTANCYEHTESPRFGGAATACPSGRIPWPQLLAAVEGDDEMFTRYPPTLADTGVAKWPTGQTLAPQQQDYVMQIAVDLPKLPADAKAIDFEIITDPGAAGALTVKDGDGRYAGKLDVTNKAGIVRVIPLNRTVRFLVEGGPVRVVSLRAVGYMP